MKSLLMVVGLVLAGAAHAQGLQPLPPVGSSYGITPTLGGGYTMTYHEPMPYVPPPVYSVQPGYYEPSTSGPVDVGRVQRMLSPY